MMKYVKNATILSLKKFTHFEGKNIGIIPSQITKKLKIQFYAEGLMIHTRDQTKVINALSGRVPDNLRELA